MGARNCFRASSDAPDCARRFQPNSINTKCRIRQLIAAFVHAIDAIIVKDRL